MSILGFDALGHWSLGHPPDAGVSVSVSLAGVTGVGVARSITPSAATGGLQGVSAGGVVGALNASPVALLIGVIGTGQAGPLTSSVQAFLGGGIGGGVAGIGVAGRIGVGPTQAFGTGVAGTFTPVVAVTVPGTSATGIAGSLLTVNPAANPLGASGGGQAGNITIIVSGGGGNLPLDERDAAPRRNDPRVRTGLLPLNKRPQRPAPQPKADPLPPYRDPAPAPVVAEALPTMDAPTAAVSIYDHIRQQMLDARDESDIERLIQRHDQDEQDIADIEAMLELMD